MFLIRFLIICICLLYVVRAIFRLLGPMLFQSIINKAQQQNQQQYRSQQYNSQQRPSDKVTVDYIPPTKKKSVPDSEGEFIDYEEIKKNGNS